MATKEVRAQMATAVVLATDLMESERDERGNHKILVTVLAMAAAMPDEELALITALQDVVMMCTLPLNMGDYSERVVKALGAFRNGYGGGVSLDSLPTLDDSVLADVSRARRHKLTALAGLMSAELKEANTHLSDITAEISLLDALIVDG